MLAPVTEEETIGEAEVRQLFRVSRLGTIAGCYVRNGVIRRGAQARVVRDGTVVYETSIADLKRFKDDAREVVVGQECGMAFEGYQDMRQGDVIECYRVETVQRSL